MPLAPSSEQVEQVPAQIRGADSPPLPPVSLPHPAELPVGAGPEGVVNLPPLGNPEIEMDLSVCAKCNLFFVSKEEFVNHRKLRACNKKFMCQPCGEQHNRVQDLISHLLEVSRK